jgi:hypothetical protein
MSRLSRFSLACIAIWGSCFVGFLGSAQRAHAQAGLIAQASTTQSNVTAGNWIYYQVSIPADSPGWRLVLAPRNGAAGKAQLFVRKAELPTTGENFRAVTEGSPKTIVVNEVEAQAGDWYVGVYLPAGQTAEAFTLKSEVGWVTDLVWDPGSAENGTQVFTIPANDLGGTHHFRITTPNSQLGLWRQVLKVTSGEANLYVQQNSAAGPLSYSAKSERAGSDGLVAPLSTSAGEGRTWYLAVQATANATWSIIAGEIFVRNLGELAANTSSSSGADVMPTEGWRFYRTTIPNNAFGWRMWLQHSDGSTTWDQTFRIRKNLAPHPATGADRAYVGQALEVPPYLTAGGTDAYFVSVAANPGTAFRFDSRQQEITDLTFGATSAPISVSGYLFRTYRFTVPPDRLGWEITTLRASGNPDVAVRRGLVANPQNNDAFSEIQGVADDSVTLVQPDLSNGTFFVTVYSETPDPYSFQLRNREPVITPISFTSSTLNNDPNRSGWRYFSITDIDSQLGRLGWLLQLSSQVPGTEIAIRRNNLPGRWSGSNEGSVYAEAFSDAHSTSGILQRPNQQADVYYVGVYTPTAQLGSFTLQTSELTPTLSSIRTSQSVDGLGVGEWKYYRIDVPAQINGKAVRGWELRVTQSAPRLGVSVRRDQLPTEAYPYNWNENFGGYRIGFTSATVWPSGRAAIFNYDWSGRASPSYEPTLSMGMGQPLEPGTYYLGFYNDASAASSFAWTSKVVGDDGSGLDYEIKPLAFGGSVNGTLSPRGVAYYYVDVPEGKASQKFRLSLPAGHEGRMYIRKDQLPNIHGGHSAVLAKQGGEYWLQLPDSGQTTLAAGRYYVMVAGEGQNPPNDYTIGTGDISFTLAHLGEAPVVDLGTVPAEGSVTSDGSYDAGEVKLHRFTVPAGTAALEVRLENRVGAPKFGVRRGEQAPGVWGFYGYSFGHWADQESESLATIPNPQPGVYSVAVGGTTPQTGSYRLRVTAVAPQSVAAAGSGSSSGSVSLVAGQRRYFAVEVPASYSGEQVLGWRLDLSASSGSAKLRVRRGGIPADGVASSEQSEWTTGSLLAVPSFLTAGTWYVELQGVTDCVASVSSSLVLDSSMLRTWTMPDSGQPTALTGLAPGLFADTGVAANGNALPGDQGVDLPAGAYHLYAVDVPAGNGGLLRTVLEAIGGNPNLFIRPLAAPSLDHVVPIPQWPYSAQAYTHALSGSAQTEYGSWVPYDVRTAQRLEQGRWYLLVFASNNTNARYRLRMSHDASPQVQNLSLNGGAVASQTLAGTDWRYYRVQMPTDPAAMPQQWTITFNQSLGSAAIFIRDTVPPGHYSGSLRDWWADGLNPGGYQNLATAGTQVIDGRNLRPAQTYYIGVRANNDCTFSLSSQASVATLGATYGSVSTINALGGSASVNLAPGETRTWRVESPAGANRWRHVSTHGTGVQVYLRENYFPAMSNTDIWRSNGAANSSTTMDFYGDTRARTYYLTAVNTSGTAQPFALTVDWRRYLLSVSSTNGYVNASPSSGDGYYDSGVSVQLTAVPAYNYEFKSWSGGASGVVNPVTVAMDGNKNVSALFSLIARYENWSALPTLPVDRRARTHRNGPFSLPNLVAYGMGLNPLSAKASDLPSITAVHSNSVKFIFRRAKGLSDVSLGVKGATNLVTGPWTAADVSNTSITDQGDYENVEVTVPKPAGGRYFLRLEATSP